MTTAVQSHSLIVGNGTQPLTKLERCIQTVLLAIRGAWKILGEMMLLSACGTLLMNNLLPNVTFLTAISFSCVFGATIGIVAMIGHNLIDYYHNKSMEHAVLK